MLNVLIVDDSSVNQFVLQTLLEGYTHKNGVEFTIEMAQNGKEAVELCSIIAYDIIFMDIMMPIMDGIQATKIIHPALPTTMIIAISAVNNEKYEQEILFAGAEDYIHKPIKNELFLSRIHHYVSLLSYRRLATLQASSTARNTINKNIKTNKTYFYIETDNAMADFWEYSLTHNSHSSSISDIVRIIHEIGSKLLSREIAFEIWIEYSQATRYFTLISTKDIDLDKLGIFIRKSGCNFPYKVSSNKISIAVQETPVATQEVSVATKKLFIPSQINSSQPTTQQPQQTDKNTPLQSKSIYTYMDADDLMDIKVYLARLNTLLTIVSGGDIEPEEIEELAVYIERMSKIATIYSESYSIGVAFRNLSNEIHLRPSAFQKKSEVLGSMCIAFGEDIAEWIRLVFEDGAPNANCMDESIIFNSLMLTQILSDETTQSTQEVVTLDEIFF